jgi:hypothetical protein
VIDLQRALELPGDDVLRENVKNNLQELRANPGPQLSADPKIFVEYNDPDDEDVVDEIASDLEKNKRYKVVGTPQVSAGKTNGDVRCFNALDLENAKAITKIVQDSLFAQGHPRTIETRCPLKDYPNVPVGTIEVWIPSITIVPEVPSATPTSQTIVCRDGTLAVGPARSACSGHGGVASFHN